MKTAPHFPTRASALLIVLWAVALMSITVLGIVEFVHHDMEETTSLEKDSRARQLAEAGIAVGLHPMVVRSDDVLKQSVAPGEAYEVHLSSEGARLNINSVVQAGQFLILRALLKAWDFTDGEADTVTDSFKEWTKRDKWEELVGKVQGFPVAGQTGTARVILSPHQLRHQFKSIDEMLLIPNMKSVAARKPDWRDYFTIWSEGRLDVNDARAELIEAVCGVTYATAQRFVNNRLGADGKPDTDDDVIFDNMEKVRQALGMGQQDFGLIAPLLTLKDSALRVESTGKLGDYQRKITVITRRNTNPPAYLQWQEQ
jgi:type II secretory pathway component PulK